MRIPHGLRAALAGQDAAPPAPTDANFENTVLLLHGDGTNGAQNNTFTDGSTNNLTVTRTGNATQGTFSPYGDNWSNYFDGTGDYLTYSHGSELAFGTGDFTVEWWMYANNTSIGIVEGDVNAGWGAVTVSGQFYWQSVVNVTNKLTTSVSAYLNSTWNHWAMVRASGTLTLYINGTSIASVSDTTNYSDTAGTLRIGYYSATGAYLNGYISNLRIVKGTAVYTSNFTPSTTPLTAITNTSLLTCQSNRFRDASTNNFTITRNGDVSVQRFSPFSPAAAYSSSTIGGSGYFDGTGDYLQIGQNSAFDLSGDFTAEFWTYALNNYTSTYTLYIGTPSGSGDYFGLKNGQYVAQFAGSGEMFWTGLPPLGAWTHLALVRSGSTVTLYQNGVSLGTATKSSTWIGSSQNVQIGAAYSSLNVNAYISNLRIVKGTAVYTAAFTPPTSPVSAITNTSLLLNFTNGGIIDNTMMNNLETVGNAQISTSVKKYGTGSLYFDGTGDWLTTVNSNNNNFGSSDFTIEFWINSTKTTRTDPVGWNYSYSNAGWGGFIFNLSASGDMAWYEQTSSRISASSTGWNNGAWNHVALTRSGNSLKMFLNGTQVGSTYTTSFSYGANSSGFIVGDIVGSGGSVNGYIDDLRITKGVARYTANFTPPTAALPDL